MMWHVTKKKTIYGQLKTGLKDYIFAGGQVLKPVVTAYLKDLFMVSFQLNF